MIPVACQAIAPRQYLARDALMRKAHWCPERSIVEIRHLESNVPQLSKLFALFQSELAETGGNPGSEPFALGPFILGGVPQDFAHFFFHAATVTFSAALQFRLNFRFQITHYKLRHTPPAIMIAGGVLQNNWEMYSRISRFQNGQSWPPSGPQLSTEWRIPLLAKI